MNEHRRSKNTSNIDNKNKIKRGSWFRRMLQHVLSRFARPNFELGGYMHLKDADDDINEIIRRRKELERRARLLGIQSTPRGPING